MRSHEFDSKRPHLYLDMDGVQADFFTAWARLFGKEQYKDIGDRAAREASIDDLNSRGPEFVEQFFAKLPPLPGGQKLISWLHKNQIPFTVLSAPLRGNEQASIRGKRVWLDQFNPGTSNQAIFTSDKQQLAQKNGQANVLVDDFKKYVNAWNAAGGIGILYRDHNVDHVIAQLEEIYNTETPIAERTSMQSHEFIAEVPMNPAAYAQSTEAGAERGVKVGFEFEVCVPEETINAAEEQQKTQDKSNEYEKLGKLPDDWYDDYPIDDDLLEIVQPITYNGQQYNDLQALHDAWLGSRIENDVKAIFDSLPTQSRMGINRQWQRELQRRAASGRATRDNVTGFAAFLRGYAIDRRWTTHSQQVNWLGILRQLGDLMLRADLSEKFLKKVFGTTDPQQLYRNPALKLNVESLLDYFGEGDDDDYYYDSEYRNAVKVLEPALKQAFGNVIVFNEYHQRRKDTSSWYIEPDGSLHPTGNNDGSAEIVSPPLPVKQSLEALKTFYGVAQNLKLYSNESTGLHINVSIPGKLDVLKLAVLLGDEHVLTQWGRIDNDYSESVMRTLKSEGEIYEYTPKTKSGLKMLQKLAKDASNEHTASISYNGTYVSFRHTGGNYLQDYQAVLNVVGRFVRGMVLASDPTAYRKEYLAKLSKLVSADPTKSTDQTLMDIMQLQKQPIPVTTVALYATARRATPRNLIAKYLEREDLAGRGVSLVPLDPADAARTSNEMLQAHKSNITVQTEASMERYKNVRPVYALLNMPKDARIHPGVRGVFLQPQWSENKIGVAISGKTNVQPGSQVHTYLIKNLLAQYKQKKIGKK